MRLRCFYATSFSPEERGSYHIRMYEEELNDDIKTMPEKERERYIAKYKKNGFKYCSISILV